MTWSRPGRRRPALPGAASPITGGGARSPGGALSRREVLAGGGAFLASATLINVRRPGATGLDTAGQSTPPVTLVAKPGEAALLGETAAPTAVWGYNGTAPGPVLRVRQGEELFVRLNNELEQPTTLHWHGIRIANAMDGVPGLTQDAVEPGGTFDYRFRCPDAGTFWYHPHKLSAEQVARGLHGLLIVEEADPPEVDQDLVLAIDDWRLNKSGQIEESSFGSIGMRAHGGRFGNTFTLNGSRNQILAVRSGERVRIRLCNVANANIFGIYLDGHEPQIVAVDGQPVTPFAPRQDYIGFAPGQRIDVIVDMHHEPGTEKTIRLITFNDEQTVGRIVYREDERARDKPLDVPFELAPNPVSDALDLEGAERVELMMDGGAMGGMRGAWAGDGWYDMRQLVDKFGYVWALNGAAGMPKNPLTRVRKGRTVVIRMVNRTRWPHAMHLHGHHVREIARTSGGNPDPHWRDTVLVEEQQESTIAFVADNPGKWMLHCHMLEHQAGGMATWFEVTG